MYPNKMIQLGPHDIFYCNNEGRQIRILNVTTGKDIEDGEKIMFQGMGEKAYIFEKYSSNQLIYTDDSSIIRIF